jgi:cytochrome c
MAKKKYKPEQIVELIYNPQPSNWPGYPPMAALPNVPKDEALKIAKWIVSLGKK